MLRIPARRLAAVGVVLLLGVGTLGVAHGATAGGGLTFSVTFPKSTLSAPTAGRVYVIASTDGSTQPRLQTGIIGGAPFWGEDVHHMSPGERVSLSSGNHAVYGFPLTSIDQLKPGRYYVQAFLNRYQPFHRSDGSTVWMHMPCGADAGIFNAVGNLYSTPRWITVGRRAHQTVALSMNQTVPLTEPTPKGGTCQQGNPPDTAHVKHIKILSPSLSRFWGRPMYIGANVLLPVGYDPNGSTRYPVEYHFDHFTIAAPHGFTEDGSNAFSRYWLSGQGPKFISVEIREDNPFYDSSYVTNSPNLGPYGTATAYELVPAIDKAFLTIAQPWARITAGGSTGGWEALASLVFYPNVFGETFAGYPDPIDLHREQLVNVYGDTNAYLKTYGIQNIVQPDSRDAAGDIAYDDIDENHYELAMGTHDRSGGAWDTWEAVYGPRGPDGYPARAWNKQSGVIHHNVTAQWQAKDITNYLRRNWSTLGPQLTGKIYLYAGDTDTYYLNDAVQLFQAMIDAQANPAPHATFVYGRAKPHGWSPYTAEQWFAVYAVYLQQHGYTNVLAPFVLRSRVAVPAGNPADLTGVIQVPTHDGIPIR